jgi:hypothetical protein
LFQQVSVEFYTDEHNCNKISFDEDATAAQICYELVQLNNAVHSPQWTLVEHIGRYRLGMHTTYCCCFEITMTDTCVQQIIVISSHASYLTCFRNAIYIVKTH